MVTSTLFSNSQSLQELWQRARDVGWAVGSGHLALYESEAKTLGWMGTSTRKGDPQSVTLRPQRREEAHPRSISAVHGLETQPLHIDGAHMPDPPDVVILYAERPNETPTRVCNVRAKLPGSSFTRDALDHGVFLVGLGPQAFLATALDMGGLRYDPAVMAPADNRARHARDYLAGLSDDFVEHEWKEGGMVLVLDNRSVLHGRSALSPNDTDRALTRQAYHLPESA